MTFLAAAGILASAASRSSGSVTASTAPKEHARVRDWHDFIVVFAARVLVFFGLTMLQTFVLFFVRDVQKVRNPSAGTAIYAICTIGGAVISSVYFGILSDRAPRKIITAIAIGCMALATIGFSLAPELAWMLPFARAVRDRIRRRDVERLGVGDGRRFRRCATSAAISGFGAWRRAMPNVVAPLVGGWLIGLFDGDPSRIPGRLRPLRFQLRTCRALRVARRPPAALLAVGMAAALRPPYLRTMPGITRPIACASGAALPRRRGPTLIIANHQHDFESPGDRFDGDRPRADRGGTRYSPRVLAGCTSRVSCRSSAVAELSLPRASTPGQMMMAFGMLPIENELGSRALSAFAWAVPRRHGPMLLAEIFDERVASCFPARAKSRRSVERRELSPERPSRQGLVRARALSPRNPRRDSRQGGGRSCSHGGRRAARRQPFI